VPAAASVKGFDEDSAASPMAAQDETLGAHAAENGVANNASHPFQGYMLAASYWPKVTTRCGGDVYRPRTELIRPGLEKPQRFWESHRNSDVHLR